jgi:hypothetical protein
MKMISAKKIAVATSAFVCATIFSFGWSEQGGISLSIHKVQAATRLYVRPYYRGHYIADHSGLPWYAVRAHYAGGPWTYGYSDWAGYASRNGIVCVPGTSVKGGDGIMYVCQ